jgi:hypothetical protein
MYVSDLEELVVVCKAIPGVFERSQGLSEYARRAMVHAFVESGQEAPPAAQRYIESGREVIPAARPDTYPGRTTNSSTGQQIVNAGSWEGLHTPTIFTMPDSTAGTPQVQYIHGNYEADNTGRRNFYDRSNDRSPVRHANIDAITGSNRLDMQYPSQTYPDQQSEAIQSPGAGLQALANVVDQVQANASELQANASQQQPSSATLDMRRINQPGYGQSGLSSWQSEVRPHLRPPGAFQNFSGAEINMATDFEAATMWPYTAWWDVI